MQQKFNNSKFTQHNISIRQLQNIFLFQTPIKHLQTEVRKETAVGHCSVGFFLKQDITCFTAKLHVG